MNFKFIVFTLLVCSLLYEINARKSNKKKNKKQTTTTAMVVTTENVSEESNTDENGVVEGSGTGAEPTEEVVVPKTVSPKTTKRKKKKNKKNKNKKSKKTTTPSTTTTTEIATSTTEEYYDDDDSERGFGFGLLDMFLNEEEEEEDEEGGIPICDPGEIRSLVFSYVLTGRLSQASVEPLRSGDIPDHLKRSWLNNTLLENDLPPIPICRNATNVESTTQEASTLSYCDEEAERRLVKDYIFKRKLSLDAVEPFTNGEIPKDDMRRKMNKVLRNAGLPPLPNCISTTTPLFTVNKLKKTTTTPITTTTTTPATTTTSPTTSSSTTTEESVIDILGLMFGGDDDDYYDYNEEYDDDATDPTDDVTEIDDGGIPICDPEAAKSLVTSYVISGELSFSAVQPLRSGEIPEEQKRVWLNRLLIDNGLPPLPECRDKDESIPVCDPGAVRALVTSYVISGELSFSAVQPLRSGEIPEDQKRNWLNRLLINNGLPSLPECRVADESSSETTTSTEPPSTTMTTTIEYDYSDSGSSDDSLDLFGLLFGGDDDYEEDYENEEYDDDDISACDPEAVKSLVTTYVISGQLSLSAVQPLRNGEIPEDKKRVWLNRTLIDNGLPPLPECRDKDESIPVCDPEAARALVTSYVISGELSFSAVQPLRNGEIPDDQKRNWLNRTLINNGLPPLPECRDAAEATTERTTTTTEEYYNYEEENVTLVSACDAEAIKDLVTSYIVGGELSMAEIQPVMSNAIPKPEVPAFLNDIFEKKGLPLLSPCKCSLPIDVRDITEVLELIGVYERAGKLEEGTLVKGENGEISLEKMQNMLVEAEITAGNLPKSCMPNPIPAESFKPNRQQQQLNQLLAIIEAGYLPEDTLSKLALGEISQEWLRANISQNRDYILSQVPKPLRTAIEEGYMPPEIEAAIFSGSVNRSEIMKMISMDDDLIKMMLPEKLKLILQDRPVPDDLKDLIFSGKNESQIKSDLERNSSILQQMMTPSMFFFYELFQNQQKVNMNTAISTLIIIVLMVVMVSLGCTMTVPQIAEHARKPKGVLIALFAQFVIMPASSFALTQLFQLEMYAAIAVLICGCCPGGNLSNMLAYSLNGDMNLSILMTTCSSILGLGMMPFSIWLYSRFIVPDIDSGNVVPYAKIMLNITMTIIPVGIGIAIKHFKPHWTVFIMRFGGFMLVICSITIAVLAGVMLEDAFFLFFEGKVLACCAILPMTGYVLGYLFAWIAREKSKCRRTICVETGCQNVQLCSVVLKMAFDPILVGVLFLLPLVYMCFQLIEAFLILFIFRMWTRFLKRKKTVDDDTSSTEKKKLESSSSTSELEKADPEKSEMKSLLDGKSSKECLEHEETALNGNTTANNVGNESDVEEIWPAIDASATPVYLDSFKPAKSDNFV